MSVHNANYSRTRHNWAAGYDRAVVLTDEQHLVECHFRSGVCTESVHVQELSRLHPELVSGGLDDGEHGLTSQKINKIAVIIEPCQITLERALM